MEECGRLGLRGCGGVVRRRGRGGGGERLGVSTELVPLLNGLSDLSTTGSQDREDERTSQPVKSQVLD